MYSSFNPVGGAFDYINVPSAVTHSGSGKSRPPRAEFNQLKMLIQRCCSQINSDGDKHHFFPLGFCLLPIQVINSNSSRHSLQSVIVFGRFELHVNANVKNSKRIDRRSLHRLHRAFTKTRFRNRHVKFRLQTQHKPMKCSDY